MAGRKSNGWHPLVDDFIFVGQKLENLGFIYHHGSVLIVESTESWDYATSLQFLLHLRHGLARSVANSNQSCVDELLRWFTLQEHFSTFICQ